MKKTLLFASVILSIAAIVAFTSGVSPAFATTLGPNFAGTGASDATVGTVAWTSPGNITTDDANSATAFISNQTTNYIKATNFGFSIPAGSTINGIQVDTKRVTNNNGCGRDTNARIVKGGSISTTNKSAGTLWPASAAYQTIGSATELWGETWSATDINASNFGFVNSADDPTFEGCTLSVNAIRITVTYTAGATASSITSDVTLFE